MGWRLSETRDEIYENRFAKRKYFFGRKTGKQKMAKNTEPIWSSWIYSLYAPERIIFLLTFVRIHTQHHTPHTVALHWIHSSIHCTMAFSVFSCSAAIPQKNISIKFIYIYLRLGRVEYEKYTVHSSRVLRVFLVCGQRDGNRVETCEDADIYEFSGDKSGIADSHAFCQNTIHTHTTDGRLKQPPPPPPTNANDIILDSEKKKSKKWQMKFVRMHIHLKKQSTTTTK